MHTIEPGTSTPDDLGRPPRRWPLAVAASLVALLVVGAILLILGDDRSEPPADVPVTAVETIPAPTTREEAAVATAQRFHELVGAGEVDAVLAMSNADRTDIERDRRLWESVAVGGQLGQSTQVGTCEPTETASGWVDVDCVVVLDDPVFRELGVEALIAPARVFDDQSVMWLPFRGDFSAANRAYAEYLQVHEPADYAAACDPNAYEPASIVSDQGLALTGQCAEVRVPLADEVVNWIATGRPEPESTTD